MRSWIGEETEPKEADFRGLMNMHVSVCKGILTRQPRRGDRGRYLYADLYAGHGNLQYKERRFPGSPIIAREILVRHGVPYDAVHFDKDPDVAAQLRDALQKLVSPPDTPGSEGAVYAETCQAGFPRWLEWIGRQPSRLGLVYADPIHDEIPVDLLNTAAEYLPKVDLLSYVSATQYKRRRKEDERRRNGHTAKPLLSAHVEAVRKGYGLIRIPRGKWQHTFILWSNWRELPEWKRAGFHRLDSEYGQRILYDWCDLTREESFGRANTPLWDDEDVLPAAPARRPALPRLRLLPAPSPLPRGPRRGVRPRRRNMRTLPRAPAHRAPPPALPAVGHVRRAREHDRRLPPVPLRNPREDHMSEAIDIRYGRLLEAAEISGLAAVRAFEAARELLESGEWKNVGSGFEDVDDFVRSIPFGTLNPPADLRKAYEAVAATHGATQRAIAQSAGVGLGTVNRDLKAVPDGAEDEPEPAADLQEQEQAQPELFHDGTDSHYEEAHLEPEPVMLTLSDHLGNSYPYPQPQSKATFNQTGGDGISWARWSWNPVTGCLHGCGYCYARAIAHRWPDTYPAGFTPLFHHDPEHGYTRLDAPANTVIPSAHRDDSHPSCGAGSCDVCAWRRVFVCSMADLYGRWVPDQWIEQVHAAMLASPQWEYILLTKFPDRYVGLNVPPGAWVGTSVDEQKRVRIAERAFREVDAAVKWLSLEPLLEPLEFSDLSMFDWVVIGAQTETHQPDGVTVPAFSPPPEWVVRLTDQAKEAGCKVHWKPNLRESLWFDEYPDTAPSRRAAP